jgi:hypothetical protein
MPDLQVVVFHEPKVGVADSEWEDGAGHRAADPATGRPARLMVADGAAEAYDPVLWVGQLVTSFVGPDGPAALDADGVDAWFGRMQERWVETPRAFHNVFAEHKFRTKGSFATLLGCDVHGLDGPQPYWQGVALGDAVLFQLRAGQGKVAQLPKIEADGFGINPDGVSTQPSQRSRMRDRLVFFEHDLRPDDVLYLTTDALAQWLLERDCWAQVAAIGHPRAFRRWVAEQRAAGMKNDDVTLLRAAVTADDVEALVLCR